jgi:hypothetical protein
MRIEPEVPAGPGGILLRSARIVEIGVGEFAHGTRQRAVEHHVAILSSTAVSRGRVIHPEPAAIAIRLSPPICVIETSGVA